MKKFNFYSLSKINLSLRVIKKLKIGLHKIQSLVTFINLTDIIQDTLLNHPNYENKFVITFDNVWPAIYTCTVNLRIKCCIHLCSVITHDHQTESH